MTHTFSSASVSKFSKFLLLLILSGCPSYFLLGQNQQGQVTYTLYLVGDSGEPEIKQHPLGGILRQQIKESGANTTLVYLGDNIYPNGMPDRGHKDRLEAEEIMMAQTNWIQGLDATGIFVPGNHDWKRGKRNGLSSIKNQQEWLDSLHQKTITLLPRDGCPGPVEIPLGDKAVLVILNTQWFLHRWEKPTAGECVAGSSGEVFARLGEIFKRNDGKRIILAAHHPIATYGEHGGIFPLKQHIFPLTALSPMLYVPIPIIGSIYPFYRKWIGDYQDIAHPSYREMIASIEKVMQQYPGNIYVAGHEHALQYILKDGSYFIGSGSGSKTSFVKKKEFARFAQAVNGFVKLKIYEDGSINIGFWQVDKNFREGKEIFTDTMPYGRY